MEDIWKDNEKTGRDQGDQGGKPGINMEDNEKNLGIKEETWRTMRDNM